MMNDWEIMRLGEVCQFIGGSQPPKSVFSKSENAGYIRLIQIRDYKSDNHIVFIPRSQARRFCTSTDIMIGRYGPPIFQILRGLEGAYNVALMKAVPDETKLLRDFLFYFLNSPKIQHHVISSSDRAAGQCGMNKETIEPYPIIVPPLPEQHRIVTILDEAFEGIATAKANAEKNLHNARALFESHLNSIDAAKVPLGDLVKITTGKLDANAAVEDGQYHFFTCSREIYAIDNYAFDCEAILLAGNNAVGDFNVKHYEGKFNAYQRTYVITVNEQKRVLYRFLYFQMLKSLKKFKEQSVGAGTKFLKLGMIKDMEIALPSIADQEKIVSTMDSLREHTDNLESIYQQKLAALEALKISLLDQAFTGQL